MSNLFEFVRKEGVIDWTELEDLPCLDSIEFPVSARDGEPCDFPRSKGATDPSRRHASPPRIRVSASPSHLFVLLGESENVAAIDQYRMIRAKIHNHEKKPQLIAVSSPCSGDGKTITSINVASAMAAQE